MSGQNSRAPAAAAAVKIIEAMAGNDKPQSLSAISAATEINKNMVSRILSVLTESEWVVCDPGGEYSLSLQLFRLGATALGKKTLMRCAIPRLEALSDITGECVQMAVLQNDAAVYIAQIESRTLAGIRAKIGAAYSLDTTAPGKALKAFAIGDPLMEETRRRGYAIDNEEYGRGVICVAAPVYDYTGGAVAAVGLASLTVNHTLGEFIERCVPPLLEQVNKISKELGYREPNLRI